MAVVTTEEAFAIKLDERAWNLRRKIVDVASKAEGAHFGPAISILEIVRVLFDDIMRYDPKRPDWDERDRFVLSKGHACLALYLLLADKGFYGDEELYTFCRAGALLGGHPVVGIPGVEATTGSLGHGFPIGAGMAKALKIDKKESRVFVIVGDGECNEGSIWEAAMFAAKNKLDNLTVLVDRNGMQNNGPTEALSGVDPIEDKWKAFGFAVRTVNGHDVDELRNTLKSVPLEPGKPSAIVCNTIKGKGFKFAEQHAIGLHYVAKPEEIQKLIEDLEALQ
jgi:Transketolase, N-terminal subunit